MEQWSNEKKRRREDMIPLAWLHFVAFVPPTSALLSPGKTEMRWRLARLEAVVMTEMMVEVITKIIAEVIVEVMAMVIAGVVMEVMT